MSRKTSIVLVSKALEPEVLAKAESNSVFLCLFVLLMPSIVWLVSTGIGEGDLYSVYQLKCQSLSETLSNTPTNHVLSSTWAPFA